MFKKIVLQAAALLFVVSIAGAAPKARNDESSKESSMKATGYDVTYNALSFKSIKNDTKAIQYLFCLNYETAPKGTDKALMSYVLGIRSRTKVFSKNSFRLEKMMGLVIVKNDTHFNINANSMDIKLEFGAIPELFITDSLSVEVPLGASLTMYGESFSNAGDSRTQIRTFGSGATLAGVTFHYYFGK
ncbi:MAG: hypothetical protein A2297_08170 [Elusimicrobia bacterium RIFOXYB2_FULL_48_7]|nr:MAG: hypothetical protein A2297_08170 [Elusimicrobia bacterium RIFOXYB2_FULL_48_7]